MNIGAKPEPWAQPVIDSPATGESKPRRTSDGGAASKGLLRQSHAGINPRVNRTHLRPLHRPLRRNRHLGHDVAAAAESLMTVDACAKLQPWTSKKSRAHSGTSKSKKT